MRDSQRSASMETTWRCEIDSTLDPNTLICPGGSLGGGAAPGFSMRHLAWTWQVYNGELGVPPFAEGNWCIEE